MGIIERTTKIGTLYISDKTNKMALNYNNQIISDQDEVWRIIGSNRIPVKAQFEITEKCNFDCYYCYAKSLRNREDLTTEQVKQIIDKLEEIGVVFLDLTGGEPLARKDSLEILKYINSKKFIVSMVTNGSYLNSEIVSELKRGNTDSLRVSLLAPTEERCDELTKFKGSFKRLIEGIHLLKENKIKFFVSSVLTNQNIDQYDAYKKLEEELSIKISYGIGVGASFTGYDDVKQYGLEEQHIETLNLFLGEKAATRVENELVCSAGKSKFAIDNQGNVLPCLKCRSVIGNFIESDFEAVWNSSELNEIITKELQRPIKCKKCKKRFYCESYCPAEYKLYDNDETRCNSANLLFQSFECKRGVKIV